MINRRRWAFVLGTLALCPGMAAAGPLSLLNLDRFKDKSSSSGQESPAKSENQQVAEGIAAALRSAGLRGYEIDIEYKTGVATLKGTVGNASQKAKCSKLVSEVRGVQFVDNRLEVEAGPWNLDLEPDATDDVDFSAAPPTAQAPAETELAEYVKRPRTSQPADSAQPAAPTDETPASAIQPAGFVKKAGGAMKELVSAASINNQQMAERIANALREANLSGYDIEIRFIDGTVILHGSVATPEQLAQATQAVQDVPGVDVVDNRLSFNGKSVRPPQARTAGAAAQPANRRAPATTQDPMANQKVAQEIAVALKRARLTGYDIEIFYNHGIATLVGAVQTPEQRLMASQAASQVAGVLTVENRLALVGQPDQYSYQQQMMQPFAYPPQTQQMPPQYQQQMPPQYQQPRANPLGHLPVPILPIQTVAYQNEQPGNGAQGPVAPTGQAMPGYPGMAPPEYGHPGQGASHTVYNMPHLPDHSWPTYASYPNYAQLTYPQEYSASAWPYIGPFYPYPQIPLGWRQVQLEWDDGYWNLNFRPRTDKWWWFLNPENW